VVSIGSVDNRDNPESEDANGRWGFFGSGWNNEEVSPSGLKHSILLTTIVKQNFVIFMSYLEQ
jgi:hypothetical protein